jgi:hypothetical protein
MTFLLAYATFIIGTLLLSIPAPLTWMRQAGFELVADSYAAVFLFTIIVALYTATSGVLSFSTSLNSAAWIQLEKLEVVAVQTEINVPKNILETIAGLAPINLEPLVSTIESMYDIAVGPMSTSPACLSNWFGETINRQGLCGVPTGAGLLGAVLAGYRYAFWDIITWPSQSRL